MSTRAIAAIVALLSMFVIAPATVRAADPRDDDKLAFDKRFVKEAAEFSMCENEISRLAKEQSNSDGVKHYAELMIGGHKKLLEELRDAAHCHEYHIPDAMTDKQRDTYDRLKRLKNTDFDVEYMSGQVQDQQNLVELFERAAKECQDKSLREFADRKVPMLKEHLDNAKELYRKVKAKER